MWRQVSCGRRLRREAPPQAGAVRNHAVACGMYSTHRCGPNISSCSFSEVVPCLWVELQLLSTHCILWHSHWTLRRGITPWFAGRHLSWSKDLGVQSGSYSLHGWEGEDHSRMQRRPKRDGCGALRAPAWRSIKSLNPAGPHFPPLQGKGQGHCSLSLPHGGSVDSGLPAIF